MAVKIRLKRMGAKKAPFYRVIVADSRSPRDGSLTMVQYLLIQLKIYLVKQELWKNTII